MHENPVPAKSVVRTPETVEDCDRELVQYRRALTLVSPAGQVAVWEQIDRILEIRFSFKGG